MPSRRHSSAHAAATALRLESYLQRRMLLYPYWLRASIWGLVIFLWLFSQIS